MADAPRRTRRRSPYRSVLRLRSYRRLWLASGASGLADWAALLVLAWAAAQAARGNPLAVTAVLAAKVVPALLLGTPAALLSERLSRKPAMAAADALRVIVCLAAASSSSSLLALVAAAFVLEAASLVWTPARDALVPQVVPNRWLSAANTISLFTAFAVFPLGAAAFGVAAWPFGHVSAMAVAAAGFAASGVLVVLVGHPGLPAAPRRVRVRASLDEAVAAARFLRSHREARGAVRGVAVAFAGGAVVLGLGPAHVVVVLGGGPSTFGAVVVVSAVGAGAGVLAAGIFAARVPPTATFAMASIAAGAGLLVFASAGGAGAALAALAVAAPLAGAAYAAGFAHAQHAGDGPLLAATMSALQTAVRASLLVVLVAFPALAAALPAYTSMSAPDAIRVSLALGGLLTVAAGTMAAKDVYSGRT